MNSVARDSRLQGRRGEEGIVDIGPQFESHSQFSVLMKPRVRALNDPAMDAKPAAVRFATAYDHRLDASESQGNPMRHRVVGAVRVETITSTVFASGSRTRGSRRNARDIGALFTSATTAARHPR
jgi:hypothetical protein